MITHSHVIGNPQSACPACRIAVGTVVRYEGTALRHAGQQFVVSLVRVTDTGIVRVQLDKSTRSPGPAWIECPDWDVVVLTDPTKVVSGLRRYMTA